MQLSVALRGLLRSPRQRGDVEKVIKEGPKETIKEGGVKEEVKPEVKPSVTLDKSKGLDVHLPVSSGNPIDFNSLQGLMGGVSFSFKFHGSASTSMQ